MNLRDKIITLTSEYITLTHRYSRTPNARNWRLLADVEDEIDNNRVLLFKQENLTYENVNNIIKYEASILQ